MFLRLRNLSLEESEANLRIVFAAFTIVSVIMGVNLANGQSLGYAWIEFPSKEERHRAMEQLNRNYDMELATPNWALPSVDMSTFHHVNRLHPTHHQVPQRTLVGNRRLQSDLDQVIQAAKREFQHMLPARGEWTMLGDRTNKGTLRQVLTYRFGGTSGGMLILSQYNGKKPLRPQWIHRIRMMRRSCRGVSALIHPRVTDPVLCTPIVCLPNTG